MAWVAKWESQRKSDRLTAKAGSKRMMAEKLGQRALWGRGYMATDDDKRRVHDLRGQQPPLSMKAIAALVGLSVGSVHRILGQPRPQENPAGSGAVQQVAATATQQDKDNSSRKGAA